MFKFKLPILVIVTVLLFSNLAMAEIFVQGGIGANSYINKDTQETFAYYPLSIGYSFEHFDVGSYFAYSSLSVDHKNSTISDDLNVYSISALVNYKPVIMGDFIPFIGLGLTYNIFNGENDKPSADSDPSPEYIKDNNCSLKSNEGNQNKSGPFYLCSHNTKFNSTNLDIRAGLQYQLAPNFSLVGAVTYSVRLNNNNDIYKNYNSLNYVASIRVDF